MTRRKGSSVSSSSRTRAETPTTEKVRKVKSRENSETEMQEVVKGMLKISLRSNAEARNTSREERSRKSDKEIEGRRNKSDLDGERGDRTETPEERHERTREAERVRRRSRSPRQKRNQKESREKEQEEGIERKKEKAVEPIAPWREQTLVPLISGAKSQEMRSARSRASSLPVKSRPSTPRSEGSDTPMNVGDRNSSPLPVKSKPVTPSEREKDDQVEKGDKTRMGNNKSSPLPPKKRDHLRQGRLKTLPQERKEKERKLHPKVERQCRCKRKYKHRSWKTRS